MNRKALLGTLLAVGLAVGAFFVMRFFPPVHMPRRLFYDSVVTVTKNGKQVTDTIWTRVPDFTMVNQLGDTVSMKDLEGKIIVADFFFTRCPSICPQMTKNMKMLQQSIRSNDKVGNREANFIQFISFSVDPERDSVAELKKYADRFQVDPQNWWLLTGDKKEIYNIALKGMSLGITEGTIDTSFIHPTHFVLIDKSRVVRARKDNLGNVDLYNGRDSVDLKNLAEDVIFLSVEKDPNKKSKLSGKLEIIAVVFGLVILGLILLFTFLKKEKR